VIRKYQRAITLSAYINGLGFIAYWVVLVIDWDIGWRILGCFFLPGDWLTRQIIHPHGLGPFAIPFVFGVNFVILSVVFAIAMRLRNAVQQK